MGLIKMVEETINNVIKSLERFKGKRIVYNLDRDKYKIGTIESIFTQSYSSGLLKFAIQITPEGVFSGEDMGVCHSRPFGAESDTLPIIGFKGPANEKTSWAFLDSKCGQDFIMRTVNYRRKKDREYQKKLEQEEQRPEPSPDLLREDYKEAYLKVLEAKVYQKPIYIIPYCGEVFGRVVTEIDSRNYFITIEKDKFYINIDDKDAYYAKHIDGINLNKKYFLDKEECKNYLFYKVKNVIDLK